MRNTILVICICLFLPFPTCANEATSSESVVVQDPADSYSAQSAENAKSIDETIKAIRKKPSPPLQSIWRYRYKGQIVYYASPHPAPDAPSYLYDERGEVLCSPSGGISGRGDGR